MAYRHLGLQVCPLCPIVFLQGPERGEPARTPNAASGSGSSKPWGPVRVRLTGPLYWRPLRREGAFCLPPLTFRLTFRRFLTNTGCPVSAAMKRLSRWTVKGGPSLIRPGETSRAPCLRSCPLQRQSRRSFCRPPSAPWRGRGRIRVWLRASPCPLHGRRSRAPFC